MAVKAKPLGRLDGKSNWAQASFVVTSGVTITAGDFVYFASGRITNASVAGARLVGMATETATGTAGSVKCQVIVDPAMRYLVDNDNVGTTFAVTHVGTYFNLVGATGAQLVDTSTTSATLGQLVCLEYNPQIDPVKDDTSVGVFAIVASFINPYVANS
jgi:hypothetical protein